jgi:hypothetical protein
MTFILSDKFINALIEAGIADEQTYRVVIDAEAGQSPRVYVCKYGGDKLLKVIDDIEIQDEA